MSATARDQLLDDLSRRVALLEGWRDGQEKFQLLLRDAIRDLGERLAAVEAAVARQDQRWESRFRELEERWEERFQKMEERLQQMDQRWETRLQQMDQQWEARFQAMEGRLQQMNQHWEARFQAMEGRLQQMNQHWEARFLEVAGLWERRSEEIRQELRELGRRFWWLMAFQFTVLLAVVALLSNLLLKG